MDEADDASPFVSNAEVNINEVLGLFDVPAFARRGHDLEYALNRLHHRLGRERDAMLDMVRLRLRQWSAVATGPDDWSDAFVSPVTPLWPLVNLESPGWHASPGPARKRRAVAADLLASAARFNRRWTEFVVGLALDPLNARIDRYNRYYVLEKECVLGSARLAARHFVPKARLTPEGLLDEYPLLPSPGLAV